MIKRLLILKIEMQFLRSSGSREPSMLKGNEKWTVGLVLYRITESSRYQYVRYIVQCCTCRPIGSTDVTWSRHAIVFAIEINQYTRCSMSNAIKIIWCWILHKHKKKKKKKNEFLSPAYGAIVSAVWCSVCYDMIIGVYDIWPMRPVIPGKIFRLMQLMSSEWQETKQKGMFLWKISVPSEKTENFSFSRLAACLYIEMTSSCGVKPWSYLITSWWNVLLARKYTL